jgi:hypothetical protein
MYVADVFAVVFTFVGLFIALPSLWLLYAALWPAATARAQERIHRSPVKTFFMGLLTAALFVVAVAALGQANAAGPAVILAAVGIGWSLFGAGALARFVGGRMVSTIEIPWRAHLRGSIVLELAFLVPLLGWLLIFPIGLILGAGATTLALVRRASLPRPVPEEKIEVMA